MDVIGIDINVLGIIATGLGTIITVVITVTAIILAWKSDRRMQELIAKNLKEGIERIAAGQKAIMEGQREITTGLKAIMDSQERIAQMLLNQTKILEKMEARMAGN